MVIAMYHDEHNPPHFHVRYGGALASYRIDSLQRQKGRLPRHAERLVLEWASLHQGELLVNWELAQRGEELLAIDPLD